LRTKAENDVDAQLDPRRQENEEKGVDSYAVMRWRVRTEAVKAWP
jgi:hypothetical protein